MKSPQRILPHLFSLSLVVGTLSSANADVIVDFTDNGNGTVTMSYSGSINTSVLRRLAATNDTVAPTVNGCLGTLWNLDRYVTFLGAPRVPFGTVNTTTGSSVAGSDSFGFFSPFRLIYLPRGYQSNSDLLGAATFAGSLNDLGLAPGTFSNSARGNTITVNILEQTLTPIPEVSGTAALAGLLALAAFGRRRRA